MSNEEENKRRIKRLIESEAETRAEPPIEPKKEEPENNEGTTKAAPPRTPRPPEKQIALDENNMPLPRRVNEVDMEGTRVSPVAYEHKSRPRGFTETRRVSSPGQQLAHPAQPAAFDWKS